MGAKSTLKSLIQGIFQPKETRTGNIIGVDDRKFVQKKHSCPICHTRIESEDLLDNFYSCISCGHHFRLNAIERINIIFDEHTFEEFDAAITSANPLDFPNYSERLEASKAKTGQHEGVVTGVGKVMGRDLVAAVMNFNFMGGSMGSVVGEKVSRAMLKGVQTETPVLICAASGGARMQEGIYSLMQMAKTSSAAAIMEKAGVPLFVLLTDPTTGGVTASFAMLGDVILAEPDSLIGFAGPRVIEGTIKQKLPPGFQRAAFQQDKGFIDAVVDRKDLRTTLAFLIDTHPIKGRS